MTEQNPTVIITHLDDEKLRKSIDSLVDYVDGKFKAMTTSTTNAVNTMQQSLNKLGEMKITSTGGGGESRSAAIKKEKKEVEDLKVSYDQMAQTLQKATRYPSEMRMPEMAQSARDSYLAFMHGFKNQATQLQQQVENWENLLVARQIQRIKDIDQQIEKINQKIKEVEHTPLPNRKQVIDDYKHQIEVLRELQQHLNNNPFSGQDTSYIDKYRAERERVLNIMKEEATAEKDSTSATSQMLAEQSKVTAEFQKQINLIQSRKDATHVFEKVVALPADTYEQAQTKLQVLQALKEKVANTPLFSQNQTQTIGNEIDKVKVKMSFLYKTTEEGAKAEKQSAEEMKRSTQRRLEEIEKEKTALKERGLVAQQSANAVRQAMRDQLQDNMASNVQTAISGLKDLQRHISDMQKGYASMSGVEQASPIGLSLKEDIRLAREAMVAVSKYNLYAVTKMRSPMESLEKYDSYKLLSDRVNRLTKEYKNMTSAERESEKGRGLIDKLQLFSRALREIQVRMSTPISLERALGNPENTLDRIAYKIQQLNAYRMSLDITDPKQVAEMKTVENEIDRLKKKQDELMGNNKKVIESNNALTRSWNYMKNRLAFYFTVGASTQFVKNLIEVRSQYEMNERALGILIDSAERGTQIFNELSQMALVSPYTLIELSSAAKQLTAYDVAAKDVVDTTRRLADMASAVGIPIERLTYALGQIKAYGYLNSRDARMFLNAGIPLVKNLADHYTELEGKMVSVGDVYDRMKKKAIGYNDVMQVITEMTDEGGKFFDFQAKMADTLKVQLANLTLAWNNMLNEIGKSEQGVIVSGIKGLKELFLQWENIDKLIRNLAITFGIAKLAQVIQIATLGMDAFTHKMVWQILVGKKLQVVLYNIAGSLKAIVSSPLTWWALLATAVVSAGMALYDANKALKEFNKSIADGGKENYENTKKFLQQYQDLRNELQIKNGTLKDGRTTPSAGVSKDEAEKAWVAIREQIELTSQSSDYFIGKLLSIDDVNKRVEKGFDYLQKIQDVYGAMSSMDDDTIAIKETYNDWWNLGLAQDGVIGNLKEYIATKQLAEEEEKKGAAWHETETIFAKRIESLWSSANIALQQYRRDLDVTLESMANFAQTQGFDFDQEKEFFSQTINKIVTSRNLGERESLQFRLDAEERYKDARIKQFDEVIEFETKRAGEAAAGAEKDRLLLRVKAAQQEKAAWLANQEEMYGEGRVLFEGFTKHMTRNHGSELQKLFGNMTKKEIEQINWSEPRWKKWAEDNAKAFAEQFGVSFDKLKKYVNDANQMTIFIRTIVQKPDDKSVYDTLTEADKAADEAWNKIQRLKTRKGELEAKGASMVGTSDIDTEYANTIQEITDAQNDYNDALAKGGHSKKENTTNTKEQKQAETELQKALKDELQLLDKVRSQYKKLTDAGVDGTTALNIVTNQFTNSIQRINNILGRNGLPLFNIKAFAGTDNPNAVLGMLKKQLDAAKVAKNIKPEEIKELEVKYGEIVIDAKVYNTKKITDGLNNELSKIKDEYELAVELDANPELGDIFTDMFGIDTTDFPKTVDEYMQRVQDAFDKGREKFNYQTPLNVFKATENDWIRWGASVGIVTAKLDEQGNIMADDTTALDKFKAKFVEAQGVAKKWAQDTTKQIQDLQYKFSDTNGKIAIEQEKLERLRQQLAQETNEQQRKLLELQIKDQENAIAKLGEDVMQMLPTYKKLFNSIAEHSAVVTRRIAKQWKDALENAVRNPDGTYTITDPISGEKATITKKEYGNQIDKVNGKLRETKSNFAKIREAFTKGEDGEIDVAKGLEYIAQEAQKAAEGLHTAADIVSVLGGSDDVVETLNDIATSMEGVAIAAQGFAQIQSGDYIGGAANAIKGTWQAINTWLDNGDKKISKQIEKSERQVRALEIAYNDLQDAMEDAYGYEEVAAKRATIANKQLQLAELQRQLQLEKSRKKKNQDQNRIMELQSQIIALRNEIENSTKEIVNDLLGISSVGDAAEQLVSSMIDAFKNGEDYMKVYEDSFEDMIDNLIVKAIAGEVVGKKIQEVFDEVERQSTKRADKTWMDTSGLFTGRNEYDLRISAGGFRDTPDFLKDLLQTGSYEDIVKSYEENIAEALSLGYDGIADILQKRLDVILESYAREATLKPEDIENVRELAQSGASEAKDALLEMFDIYGIKYGENAEKTLSNLQQGLQSMSEETGSALEAYMNGVSQQVYLQSGLLTQIRDAVVAIDSDVQLATNAQILLQLQQSYAVQMAIQSILMGWSTPSGMAVRVELNS